jgi:hypothetical protein
VKQLFVMLAVLLLVGCATLYEPVLQGYDGPTARLSDTVVAESGSKGQFFVLAKVDGKDVNNSILASREASHGQGFALTTSRVTRLLPVTTMTVKLIGTHQTAAPIHELASRAAGTFFSVEGKVVFTPVAGAEYVVKGVLEKDNSSVWIEDVKTNQAVTEKVRSK